MEEAVTFTQSIVEKVDAHPEMEKEMQKAFAMIAFEKPEDSPYTYLLEMSHRQMVCSWFLITGIIIMVIVFGDVVKPIGVSYETRADFILLVISLFSDHLFHI